MARLVRKRCETCGHVRRYRPRQRRCEAPRGMLGSYICGGRLRRVVRPARERPAVRPQDVAQRKLAHARKMVAEKTTAMRRLATSLHLWERRAAHYARRASMTDAEVAAERARRLAAAARPKRRGIALGEDPA